MEYETVDTEMTRKYLVLMHNIENEGPLTALDFFAVDKSLVTAAFATVVTYLIILIQFDLC